MTEGTPSTTRAVSIMCGTLLITLDKTDPPVIRSSLGKTGSCVNSFLASLCGLANLALMNGAPISDVISVLEHQHCHASESCSHIIATVLNQEIKENGI